MSVAEFLAAEVEFDLPDERALHHILLDASQWCDDYVGMAFDVHRYVEHRQLRPDRDGRLVWRPHHRPFLSLESLTCGRTTYATPQVSVEDERTVVVDLKSVTASWTGGLQFGIDGESATVWRYSAGYPLVPEDVSEAVTLYALSLLLHDPIKASQCEALLDPYRG